MEPSSKLPGAAVQRLQDALLSAFPTRSALVQMVRVGLDENLDAVAAPENLSVAVFELIKWAEAKGRLDALVSAARNGNPGNPELSAFAEERGKWAPDPPDPLPTQSSGAKVEPAYESAATRALAEQLEQARLRKRALEEAGASTAEVDHEILNLRRRLREGGQLRAGDALEDGRYLTLSIICPSAIGAETPDDPGALRAAGGPDGRVEATKLYTGGARRGGGRRACVGGD